MPRTFSLRVRLTEDEKNRLKVEADKRGVTTRTGDTRLLQAIAVTPQCLSLSKFLTTVAFPHNLFRRRAQRAPTLPLKG